MLGILNSVLSCEFLIIAASTVTATPTATIHPCTANNCGAFAICLVNETAPFKHHCQCRVGYAASDGTTVIANGSYCQGYINRKILKLSNDISSS